MSEAATRAQVEWWLAGLLQYGSWLASIAIGTGLALSAVDARINNHWLTSLAGGRLVTAGIVSFIGLPVLRVALMLVMFLRRREYHLSAVAGLVLGIIIMGFLLGMHTAMR